MKTQPSRGLTIVEILVALAILGLLTALLTTTLTGSLSLDRRAQQELKTSSEAQRLIETVRGAWDNKDNYRLACVPNWQVPDGYEVTFINLDTRAQPVRLDGTTLPSPAPAGSVVSRPIEGSCVDGEGDLIGSPPVPPPMRQVVVQSPGSGREAVKLSIFVLEPL